MNREEVISRMCKLASKVNTEKFKWSLPSDCFCEESTGSFSFQFDEEVLEFIEQAVKDKLDTLHDTTKGE